MPDWLQRTGMLLGEGGLCALRRAKVAVFGLGGVGGHAAEALARSGVMSIDLFDFDTVAETNLNRQLCALNSTLGGYKTEVIKNRLLDISPQIKIGCHNVFYSGENAAEFPLTGYDYILDAIDSVPSKLELIKNAKRCGTPIISSMGMGNRLDPTALRIGNVYATSKCPLAREMRRQLRKIGIDSLNVVYSLEDPLKPVSEAEEGAKKRNPPGSTAFVPASAGLAMAYKAVSDIVSANKAN